MLPESSQFLCSSTLDLSNISPKSQLFSMNNQPKTFKITSSTSFVYCDIKDNRTMLYERHINSPEVITLCSLDKLYTSCNYSHDHALFLNREGDLAYYNFLNQQLFFAQKQHPGVYSDADILSTNSQFITCGGSIKNQLTGQYDKLIKLWSAQQDVLSMQARINTGHTRQIESGLVIGRHRVVTFSFDRTIRVTNLVAQQLEKVMPVELDLAVGCQLDHNSFICGGIGNKMCVYDVRMKRMLRVPLEVSGTLVVPVALVQITKIMRLGIQEMLVANINELLLLEMRMMKMKKVGRFEQDRICGLAIMNQSMIVVGNLERKFQVWEVAREAKDG